MGRIFNNQHITNYDVSLKQKLQQCNSDKDYQNILHIGDSSKYDADNSKDFSAAELKEAELDRKTAFTVFEQDKVKELADGMKQLDDDDTAAK